MSGRRIGLRIVTLADVGTTLTLSAPASVVEGVTFQATGRLTRNDNGEGIPGASVELSLDGILLSSANTDSSGYYAFYVTIYDPGNYTLMASYSGGVCAYGCETVCESACEYSCEDYCEDHCEEVCEESCQQACLDFCQEGCEVVCETPCEYGGCETACEMDITCEISCQSACELDPGCEVVCEAQCEYVVE